MMYSVWNWDKEAYDYYDGPGVSLGDPVPSATRGNPNGAGINLDAALPPLPSGARYTGSGSEAKGRVARTEIFSTQSRSIGVIGTALGAFVLYKAFNYLVRKL